MIRIHQQSNGSRRHAVLLAFLLGGFLLARLVLSKPLDTESCLHDTEQLYSNAFVIAEKMTEMDTWAELQRSIPENICTVHTRAKTTCTLDYVNFTDSSEWCLDVPDSMYVVTDFVYKCAYGPQLLFYNVRNRPACYASFTKPASSCYTGYDNTIIESIELDSFKALISEFTNPTTLENEWGQLPYIECNQMRFIVSEPKFSAGTSGIGPDRNIDSRIGNTSSCHKTSIETQLSNDYVLGVESMDGKLEIEDRSYIDYGKVDHNISSICKDNLNGIYLEISYSVSCTDSESIRIFSEPLCLSKMTCGEANFESEAIAYASSRWSRVPNCELVTATASGTGEGALTWEDFSASASPTVTPGPTTTTAPSLQPTMTPQPTESMAPSQMPSAVTCMDDSMRLILDGEKRTSEERRIFDELETYDELFMVGLSEYCTPEDNGYLCEIDYNVFDETTSDGEKPFATICRSANTVYVEDSVSITCVGEDGSVTTKLAIKNKPSCRSKRCNADGVQDVAALRLRQWMKLTLEQGIDAALTKGNETISSSTTVLTGRQSCVINEEEGITVSVGGTILNEDSDPVDPSEECLRTTDDLSRVIEIYNERILIQRTFETYVDVDLRQICGSPKPNVLECRWDWNEVFPDSEATMKATCMPDQYYETTVMGRTRGSTRGQYVESTVRLSCIGEESELIITNTNVPGCVGIPCTPGESQSIVIADYDLLTKKLAEEEGFSCTTEVLSTYAAHYDPFYETYSVNGDSNPQAEKIIQEEKITDAPTAPVGNPGSNVIVIQTETPTGTPVALEGPKFGQLFSEVPTGETHKDSGAVRTQRFVSLRKMFGLEMIALIGLLALV